MSEDVRDRCLLIGVSSLALARWSDALRIVLWIGLPVLVVKSYRYDTTLDWSIRLTLSTLVSGQ